jgi:protein-disulfide isomerase
MLKTALCATLAVVAASCTKSGAGLAPESSNHGPTMADIAGAAAPGKDMSGVDLPSTGTVEERLARVEHRVNKISEILAEVLPPKEADPSRTYAVAIDPTDPIEGPSDAKVTIVEGFEFLCPYCYRANPTVEQIKAAYPKDVRIVNKYFLIHGPPAIPPGMAACAANKQGKFSDMKKALWEHIFGGGQPDKDSVTPESLVKLAGDMKLDVEKFKTDMNSADCQAWLEKSQEILQPVGTTGTPSFYVNGRHLNGAVPFDDFKKVIDEELSKADKAIAGGVPQAEYYQREVMAKGDKKVGGYFDD